MRLRFTLAALGLGATITAGCGVLLDLSHLDDGTGAGTSGGGEGTGTGPGGAGGVPSMTSSASSHSAGTTAAATSGSGTGGAPSSSAGTGGGGLTTSSASSSSGSSSSTGGIIVGPPPIAIDIVGPPALHFKIDATEVTVQNYATFIKDFEATPPALQKQHDVCGWNHSVRPNTVTANDAGITTAPECDTFNLDNEVIAHPNAPMRCVDWCDAAAYCLWANGHMCQGDEGGQGYPVEWKNACQGSSGQKFPYGLTYQAGRCVDAPAPAPLDVKQKPICVGGYPGVYDMSGNVAEWLNCGCEYDNMDSTKTNAFLGGGAYHNTGDELDCTPVNTTPIVGFRKDVGIRCCYGP